MFCDRMKLLVVFYNDGTTSRFETDFVHISENEINFEHMGLEEHIPFYSIRRYTIKMIDKEMVEKKPQLLRNEEV